MDPATGALILSALLKYGPALAQQIATLFSKPTHSLEDWIAIFDKVKSYEEMNAASLARVGLTQPPV